VTRMSDESDEQDDYEKYGLDVAKANGDIRIYMVADKEVYLQSDTSVDELLDDTDSDPTYNPDTDNRGGDE